MNYQPSSPIARQDLADPWCSRLPTLRALHLLRRWSFQHWCGSSRGPGIVRSLGGYRNLWNETLEARICLAADCGQSGAVAVVDGDANNADVAATVNLASPTLADLLYDPVTGNVKLDATEAAGGIITNFVLKNDPGGADFNAPGVVSFPFAGIFQTDLATEISNTDGTTVGFSGVHDLGDIFPTGLTQSGLESFLTQASYVGALGTGNPEFDLIALATVEGRFIAYNMSTFDGNDAAANAADDGAIAPDKSALLPGGTATFANYTSYSKGINEIIVDIENLPGTPTVAAFEFAVGNNNTPSTWTAAPAPNSIVVRPGAGVGGSDRVHITWANNAIEQQWLEVTVKANAVTGLAEEDIFYFGNAKGESGNSTANAEVNATDQGGARDNFHNAFDPALIDDVHDHNRDARVNATDQAIARDNFTNAFTALRLISVPAAGSGTSVIVVGAQQEAPSEQPDVIAGAAASSSSTIDGDDLLVLSLASVRVSAEFEWKGSWRAEDSDDDRGTDDAIDGVFAALGAS